MRVDEGRKDSQVLLRLLSFVVQFTKMRNLEKLRFKNNQNLKFGHIKFEIPSRHPLGDIR